MNTTTFNKNYSECKIPGTFANFNDFLLCYSFLADKAVGLAFFQLSLGLLAFIFNTFIIILIFKKRYKDLNIFDSILIGHSIVNGITGIVDIPIYHFLQMFGYWPFGRLLCLIWSSYDNNINTTTNLHMIYMSWVRFRSVKAPRTFKSEWLVKHPSIVMVLIWTLSLMIWSLIVNLIGVHEKECKLNIYPTIVTFFIYFVLWGSTLVILLVINVYLIYFFVAFRKRSHKFSKNRVIRDLSTRSVSNLSSITQSSNNCFRSNSLGTSNIQSTGFALVESKRLSVELRFYLLIFSYWFQWTPPCIAILVNTLCNCISEQVINAIYWLTFTVCLTDPIVSLMVNTNIMAGNKKSIQSIKLMQRASKRVIVPYE